MPKIRDLWYQAHQIAKERAEKKKMQKGLTLTGLIYGFILLAIFFGIVPALSGIINNAVPSLDANTAIIAALFPMFFLLMILIGIWNSDSNQTGM